jgi:hypothetical protein
MSSSNLVNEPNYICRHQLPLRIWFLAIHLITQSKTGLSALALKRQIGVSYNTAWKLKHKIMQVMKERDDVKPLSGFIQLDDVTGVGKVMVVSEEEALLTKPPL